MKPVILLIPGTLNDAEVWADVVPELAARAAVRVAAIGAPASIAAAAAGAWEALSDIADATFLVLAGFSMGGYVAIEMLARARRPVHGAALISTSARPDTPEATANRARTIAALRTDFGKTVERVIQWSTEHPSPGLVTRMRQMMMRVGAETAIRQNEAVGARADHRAALAQLRLPVHVLCGTGDRVTPPALPQDLAALIPGARLQLVEGAGHMLPMEQPGTAAKAIAALLD